MKTPNLILKAIACISILSFVVGQQVCAQDGSACKPYILEMRIIDNADYHPVENVELIINNTSAGITDTLLSITGIMTYTLDGGSEYEIIARRAGYFAKRTYFENCKVRDANSGSIICAYGVQVSKCKGAITSPEYGHICADIPMEKVELNYTFTFKNIYYDLDKDYIRKDAAKELNKLVNIALDNPSLIFELSSHCDSRGSDEYNMDLSQRRAESAVAYLVKKGVQANRLTAKGYGESELVNHCSNDVKCSSSEHQENRRTEFKVIGIDEAIEAQKKKMEMSRVYSNKF